MRCMIEFFKGSGRMAKAFETNGYFTKTLDNNPEYNADYIQDFLSFDINQLPKEFIESNNLVLWFGVPCTKFSVAGRNTNFTNFMPNNKDSAIALALVFKCFELINALKPKYWFIENPTGYLRKFPFMSKYVLNHLWYCKYGHNSAKPTDIFSNISFPTMKCSNNANCHHERAPRGSKSGTQGYNNAFDRGTYPINLCEEIVKVCENKTKEIQNILTDEVKKDGLE